ncbi:MAG: ABC transporter substrate-binding protein, partial [Planctomycetota bacterium]
MRVVSLLPSATESLCLLGGAPLLVGRSHECDFPPSAQHVPTLTSQVTAYTSAAEIDRAVSTRLASGQSLYHLDTERLQELRPDLVITQDLCDVCSIDLETVRAAAAAMQPTPEVLSLNPTTFEHVLDDLIHIGRAIGMERDAQDTVVALRQRFFAAADFVNPYADRPSVAFLEWTDPPYIGGHWTPQLIERAGATHPLNPTEPMQDAGAGAGGQYAHRIAGKSTRIAPEQLTASEPDFLVVCPCGLDLEHTRHETEALRTQSWFASLQAVQAGRVALVDGNQMFNRPGPRRRRTS